MNYILYAPEYIVLLFITIGISIYIKSYLLLSISLAIFIGLLFFFRASRHNNIKINKNTLYSPCNGVVKDIVDMGDKIRIIVFLNIHNIHVQYLPCDCKVKSITYHSGSFHPAYLLEKSIYNERYSYVLENDVFGEIGFMQIAGQVARRIIPFVKVNDKVNALEPIGLIKFGSRCDIILNKNISKFNIKKNQSIQIGDIIATK